MTTTLTNDKLIEQFHVMWDGFPGLARLIDDKHNIIAANPFAQERGFLPGANCVKVGDAKLHHKCKLNRFFNDGQSVCDHVLEDRIRGWIPVEGHPNLCIHFALMIPEE